MADELVPAPGGPPVLDRAGLERVLARAAELQAAVGDAPEALTEAQLLDLGSEVGLSPEHLRQALAEERGRDLLPPERGLAVTFTGAQCVAAARMVPGTPASVLSSLDTTMQRDEVLVIKRRFPERLTWEAQRGLVGGLRRGFALGGRPFHLAGASEVSASVAAVDSTRVYVRVVASFADGRRRRLEWATVGTTLIALTTAPLLAIGIGPLLAIAPPVLASGLLLNLIRRQYRGMLSRAQVALEQILDRLEYGARRPSAATSLLEAFVGRPRTSR